MTNQRAIILLSQMYIPAFDEEERDAITKAIEALTTQEPVKPKIEETILSQRYNDNMFKNYYCGNCGEFLNKVIRIDKFCSQCGMAVKWE